MILIRSELRFVYLGLSHSVASAGMTQGAESMSTLKERIAAHTAKRAVVALSASAPDERRWGIRKSGIVPAFIISDRLQGTVVCIVRDVSATGARLILQLDRHCVVASATALPPTFKLLLDRENVEVDCALAWATDRSAGVRFMSSLRHLPVKARKAIARPKK